MISIAIIQAIGKTELGLQRGYKMIDINGAIVLRGIAGLYRFGETSILPFTIDKAVSHPKIRMLHRFPIPIEEVKASGIALTCLGDILVVILASIIEKEFVISLIKDFGA